MRAQTTQGEVVRDVARGRIGRLRRTERGVVDRLTVAPPLPVEPLRSFDIRIQSQRERHLTDRRAAEPIVRLTAARTADEESCPQSPPALDRRLIRRLVPLPPSRRQRVRPTR